MWKHYDVIIWYFKLVDNLKAKEGIKIIWIVFPIIQYYLSFPPIKVFASCALYLVSKGFSTLFFYPITEKTVKRLVLIWIISKFCLDWWRFHRGLSSFLWVHWIRRSSTSWENIRKRKSKGNGRENKKCK